MGRGSRKRAAKLRDLARAFGVKPTQWQVEVIKAMQGRKHFIAPRRAGLDTLRRAMAEGGVVQDHMLGRLPKEYPGEFVLPEAAVLKAPAPQCAPGELPLELREDYVAPMPTFEIEIKELNLQNLCNYIRGSSWGIDFVGSGPKMTMIGTPIHNGGIWVDRDDDDDHQPSPKDLQESAVAALPGPRMLDHSKRPKPHPAPKPRPHPKPGPYRSVLDAVADRAIESAPTPQGVDLDAVFGVQSKRA